MIIETFLKRIFQTTRENYYNKISRTVPSSKPTASKLLSTGFHVMQLMSMGKISSWASWINAKISAHLWISKNLKRIFWNKFKFFNVLPFHSYVQNRIKKNQNKILGKNWRTYLKWPSPPPTAINLVILFQETEYSGHLVSTNKTAAFDHL